MRILLRKVLERGQVLKFVLAVYFAAILTFQILSVTQLGGSNRSYNSGILQSSLAQQVTTGDEKSSGCKTVETLNTINITCPHEEHVYDKHPWKFTYDIVKQEGLVLHNLRAQAFSSGLESQEVYRSVSVPHFKIEYPGGFKIVRYCGPACGQSSELKSLQPNVPIDGTDSLQWSFEQQFNESNIMGTLRINYDYLINWNPKHNCEYFQGTCYRFIPKVSFLWSGMKPVTLSNFTAYYKFDYGNVGIGFVSNSNNFAGNAFLDSGYSGQVEIQTKETKFNAVPAATVVNCPGCLNPDYHQIHREGKYDNIHTAHPARQQEGMFGTTYTIPGQDIVVPGCRARPGLTWATDFEPFDCVHTHWRWSETGVISEIFPLFNWAPNIDPMVEPSTDEHITEKNNRGEPYLVPNQQIDIALVAFNEGEKDPDK